MTTYELLNKKFDELLIEVGTLRSHLEETTKTVTGIERTLTGINKKYEGFSKRLITAESDIKEINEPTET